jgi:uncharacterized membrane protein
MENLHPILTHFAPAAYVGAVLLELARLKYKSSSKIEGALDILIAVMPLAVLMAFFSGYLGSDAANQTFSIPEGEISEHHAYGRLLLFLSFPCTALYFVQKVATNAKEGFAWAYRLFLLACFVLVIITGDLGGDLVFEYGAGVSAKPEQHHLEAVPSGLDTHESDHH